MIVAGVDIGSLTVKAVILRDNEVVATSTLITGDDAATAAKTAINEALKSLAERGMSVTLDSLDYIVATGVGRKEVTFAHEEKTDVRCDAVGARHIFPSVRTVVDIGAESCKVIRLSKKGRVEDFTANDKCASGTGMFLDVLAKVIGVGVEKLGELSLKAKKPAKISSMCTVFAESEVISYIHRKVPIENIIAGVHESIANRIFGMMNRVGVEKDIALVGGVARNVGVVKALEAKVGESILVPEGPQLIGALGAALIAAEACGTA
ncbi:MAG TPA: 2-hydroxyglutaryl-CoA dehydratase [Methanomicrobia archaeon]|nr:2-hydroxyglutaryl-CoA dehydratase [Methanomicrobia archaeon]HEX59244.1 2-hydroxyglutaryl-CoA dehydratase [Methanomicrobia archaeon]